MGDDGLGVHAVKILKNLNLPENIEIIDGGTKGLDLLTYLENKDALIIIDAINFNKKPGELIILKDDDIKNYFRIKFSMHEIGLGDLISAADLLDILPEKIIILGFQPEKIELTTELSETLKDNLPLLIENVKRILKEWGVNGIW